MNFEGPDAWFKKGIGQDSSRIRGVQSDSIDKIWRRLEKMGMINIDDNGRKICKKLEFEIIDYPDSVTDENKKVINKYLSDLWDILLVYKYNLLKQ